MQMWACVKLKSSNVQLWRLFLTVANQKSYGSLRYKDESGRVYKSWVWRFLKSEGPTRVYQDNIRPPPPLPLSECLVSVSICVNHPRYKINPAAINAMIAVNVLYHEDTEYRYNKKQSCCYTSNPNVKWNPLFKGHTILVHAITTNTMFTIVYVHYSKD